jgi:hypothetical protein
VFPAQVRDVHDGRGVQRLQAGTGALHVLVLVELRGALVRGRHGDHPAPFGQRDARGRGTVDEPGGEFRHTAQQLVEGIGGQQQRRQFGRGAVPITLVCHVRTRPTTPNAPFSASEPTSSVPRDGALHIC